MRRRWLTGLVIAVAAGGFAFLAWLPLDPFELPAGPLDTCVPGSVDSAWRFDGPALLRSPFARTAWGRPATLDLRARLDVEGRIVGPLRRAEQVLAAATLGFADPLGLERDLMPAEVIVATRGDDVLFASRISSRARAIDLIRKLPTAQLASFGLSAEGPVLVLRGVGMPAVHIVRHRDVLLASTSREFLDDAQMVASEGAHFLADEPGAHDALEIGRAAGPRILGWARSGAVARRVLPPRDADAHADGADEPWWAAALRAPDAAPLRIEVRLDRADALEIVVRCTWESALPGVLEPLAGRTTDPAPALAAVARALAPPDETIVSGGLAASAESVLAALLASQPPERQDAFEAVLGAAGESVGSVAAALSRHVRDGVAFVVGRLRESDALLGGDDAGAVRAIPATLVVFRLNGPEAGDALLGELRDRAETLFDAPLGDTVEVLADGTRLHTLKRQGLAGQWELLRPAFAFRGETFLFATHDGFLRRALGARREARDAPQFDAPVPPGVADERTLLADLATGPLRAWIGDQSWEHADRATWRDWAEERRKIEDAVPADTVLRPDDVITYVDSRVREMRRIRREREIPEAAAAWRAQWEWLEQVGDATIAAEVEAQEATIRVRVSVRREE